MTDHKKETSLQQAERCLIRLRSELFAARVDGGYWTGELSASALSTATAISALSVVIGQSIKQDEALIHLVTRGCRYLDSQQNADGGYGDTDRNYSNIATSYLVLAGRTLAAKVIGDQQAHSVDAEMESLRQYITAEGEIEGLRKRYGTDKTFVVPIMTNLAIAGLMDWKHVSRLPFEAAVVPGSLYRFMRMPVVSYAIPALVAIGQSHHFLGPKTWLPLRKLRSASVNRTTGVLRSMQPKSGGYLEATPLTSFVLMSLAACASVKRENGFNHDDADAVMKQCVQFLTTSIREDGSWPIDTNLATWITSLSIHALGRWSGDDQSWANDELVQWHLNCQYHVRHPFTGASPGGWGWTDLSGAVPDGDDTPAAILAALNYRSTVTDAMARTKLDAAIAKGLNWLADLQNSDGGLPTFCRGWGQLPFDRSSTDLTAHFIRAIDAAEEIGAGQGRAGAPLNIIIDSKLHKKLLACRTRAIQFLRKMQRADGSWLPLWFGNQDNLDDENPIYGTARVLLAIGKIEELTSEAALCVDYLLSHQNEDAGWGGGPSVAEYFAKNHVKADDSANCGEFRSGFEETCVAVEAIADYLRNPGTLQMVREAGRVHRGEQAIINAVQWLVRAVNGNHHHHAWPIGFYFAKLWYYEKLYPLVFATAAMSAAIDTLTTRPPFKVETSN